eukprot:gene1380-12001_t
MGNKAAKEIIERFIETDGDVREDELRNIFDSYDKSRDGSLQHNEVEPLIKDIVNIFIDHVQTDLKSSNPTYSAEVFAKTKKEYTSKDYRKKVLQQMDKDGDKEVDFPEFKLWMSEFFQNNISSLLAKKTSGQILIKEFNGVDPEGGDKGLRFEVFDISKESSVGFADENFSVSGKTISLNIPIEFQIELSLDKDGSFKNQDIMLNIQDSIEGRGETKYKEKKGWQSPKLKITPLLQKNGLGQQEYKQSCIFFSKSIKQQCEVVYTLYLWPPHLKLEELLNPSLTVPKNYTDEELTDLRKREAMIKEEFKSFKKKIMELEVDKKAQEDKKKSKWDRKIESIKSDIAVILKDKISVENQVKEMKREIEAIQLQIEEDQQTVEQKHKDLLQGIEDYKLKIKEIEENISDPKTKQLEEDLNESEIELKKIQEIFENLHSEYEKEKIEKEKISKSFEEKQKEIERIEKEIDEIEKEEKSLLLKLQQDFTNAIQTFSEKENDFKSKETDFKKRMNDEKFEIDSLNFESESLKTELKQLNEMKKKLNSETSGIDMLEKKIEKLLIDISNIQINKEERIDELKKLPQEIKEIKQEIQFIENYLLIEDELEIPDFDESEHQLWLKFKKIFKIKSSQLNENEQIEYEKEKKKVLTELLKKQEEKLVEIQLDETLKKKQSTEEELMTIEEESYDLKMSVDDLINKTKFEKESKINEMDKLEKELIEFTQQIENDKKKIETFEMQIETIDSQVDEEISEELELSKKLNEMKDTLLPKLKKFSDEQLEELDNRLVMDPIGSLRDGVSLLLQRITENSEKYKGKSINEVSTTKFDPQLEYYVDVVIIPALFNIFNGGFQTFWFSKVHFWQILENFLIKRKQDEEDLQAPEKLVFDIVDDTKSEYDEDDKPTYDELTTCFLKNCIIKKSLFIVFNAFIKDISLLKQYYTTDSILRNTDATSKVRKLIIVLSKTPLGFF